MKLTVLESFRRTEITAWAQQHLGAGTRMVSDGLACFAGVTAAHCVHEPIVVGSGRATIEHSEFRWVNTILSNVKNALCGTYHAVRPKYAQRYPAELEDRFNRRFDLPGILPTRVYVALKTPPMPGPLLELRLARRGVIGKNDQGAAPPGPPHEVRRQDLERPDNTETDAVAPVPGGVPAAERGAQEPRIVVPGAAAQHPLPTIPSRPRAPVSRRSSIAPVPAVLHPLQHVPMHIVQTEIVHRKRAHLHRLPSIRPPRQIRSDCWRGVAGVKRAPTGFRCCSFARPATDFAVLGRCDGDGCGRAGRARRSAGVSGGPSCAEGGWRGDGGSAQGRSGGRGPRAGVGGHLEEVEHAPGVPGEPAHGHGLSARVRRSLGEEPTSGQSGAGAERNAIVPSGCRRARWPRH